MKIGKDVYIHEDAWIKQKEGSKIGNHVAIDKGVQFSTKVDIGDYVHIAPYVVSVGGKDTTVCTTLFTQLLTSPRGCRKRGLQFFLSFFM